MRRLAPLSICVATLCLACANGDDPRDGTTAVLATSGDAMTDDGGPMACVPGTQSTCACPGQDDGVQVCLEDGSGVGECMCGGADGTGDDDGTDTSVDETGEPDPCGNSVCDAEEDCRSCEVDCGVCEPCTLADSCEGAQIPPPIDTHVDFLDDPMAYIPPPELAAHLAAEVEGGDEAAAMVAAALSPALPGEASVVTAIRDAFAAHPSATAAVKRQLALAGMPDPTAYRDAHPAPTQLQVQLARAAAAADLVGAPDPTAAPCDDPRMRVRVATLYVHEEDDDFTNDQIYCAITAEAAEASEIKVTPITPALDEGDQYSYGLEAGVVWGQADLAAPKGNLLINYNCIESDTENGYVDLLQGVSDAANAAAGVPIPGVDGWVFPAVGIVTGLLAGALSLDGDDLLFNGTQVIPETEMLNLTSGGWWSVRREGTNLNSDWDWELRMEIWGCHDNAG